MKIIDSHCHAWALWPYSAEVPDPESRGIVEQLLYEMDVNGVDEATIVSAQIKGNPENNAYIAAQVARYPEQAAPVCGYRQYVVAHLSPTRCGRTASGSC